MVIVVGVAGGSGSGKKLSCDLIAEFLFKNYKYSKENILILRLCDFYREWTTEENEEIKADNFDFDHPSSFDFDLLLEVLQDFKSEKGARIPYYDRILQFRSKERIYIGPPTVVLLEGTLSLYDRRIYNCLDLKIFMDDDSDTRLTRIGETTLITVVRKTQMLKRNLSKVIHSYLRFVKPGFYQFVLPTKSTADIIIPRGADNQIALEIVAKHIYQKIK